MHWSIDRLIACLIVWLPGWLIDWLLGTINWLVIRSIDPLIDWLTDHSPFSFFRLQADKESIAMQAHITSLVSLAAKQKILPREVLLESQAKAPASQPVSRRPRQTTVIPSSSSSVASPAQSTLTPPIRLLPKSQLLLSRMARATGPRPPNRFGDTFYSIFHSTFLRF